MSINLIIMKSFIFIFLIFSFSYFLISQNHEISIIPKPSYIKITKGEFIFDNTVEIYTGNDRNIYESVQAFVAFFEERDAINLKITRIKQKGKKYISLNLSDTALWCGDEGYRINVNSQQIEIFAMKEAGLFYALQTLKQLILISQTNSRLIIPNCYIQDRPRFKWRGMNLDCCRHFMEKDFIKRYIDLLALYKMNVFHWHLTEDQAWRIEIKKYPFLTEKGAWRIEKDGNRYGGFYSQDDIREIVAYASARYITVVPEIEMPGHSLAALSAYPQLSCTGGPFQVENSWGVFKDIYCVGNDSVFIFLENVLIEVMELFPSKYIHIGGDEAPKYRWENCLKCQKRIKEEGLKDEDELQSWFIQQIEEFLNKHNRKIIGWDEILEGGLAPSATVQSWRGFEGAFEAASNGHDAIVSPTSHCYFDYDVSVTNLEKVYSFEPIPDNLTKDKQNHILGGECNMWTEYAPQELIDSKVFPRICAISEVLWISKEKKFFEDFHTRLQKHYPFLDKLGVNYGFENEAVIIDVKYNEKNKVFIITLKAGQEGLTLHYTIDGSLPDKNSSIYKTEITQNNSCIIQVLASREKSNSFVFIRKLKMHKAIAKKYQLINVYSSYYSASGPNALCDGLRGTSSFRDGLWQGFSGVDFEVIIDLEESEKLHQISVGFLQSTPSWIFYPIKMEVWLSENGTDWEKTGEYINIVSQKEEAITQNDFIVKFPEKMASKVKIIAPVIKTCPDWHPGAGSKTWLFVDEIIVE